MEITTLISPVQRAFGLQNKVISSAFQCLTKQFLTYSCTIYRCGIDVIHAMFMTNIKQALRVLNCRISVCPDKGKCSGRKLPACIRIYRVCRWFHTIRFLRI